jgi:murein L,D-transpeptidase YcbB/YkuD
MPLRRFGTLWLIVLAQAGTTAPDDIRRAIETERAARRAPMTAIELREVASLYDRSANAPLWLDAAGAVSGNGRAALALLDGAAAEGLDPASYDVPALVRLSTALDASPRPPASAAELDVRLTAAVLRYYRHLHLGRVDPRSLGWQIAVPAESHDMAGLLWSALHESRVAETAAELPPPMHQYIAVKTALARYRALVAGSIALPEFAATVKPGQAYAGVAVLQRFLVAVGDAAPDTPLAAAGTYDDALAAAVTRFQTRHGLDADGVIGPATQAALRVPLAWRVRQLELALERLRWLPDLAGGRLIVVNIPMFRLWAWDRVPATGPADLSMAVIVGRALNTRTPVFAEQMRYVVFRPYWNVPRSIARGEVLPGIRKDPGYLDRQNMELVRGESDNAPAIAATPEHLAELERGTVRVRQRPGPKNALGLVKFMLPNQNNVYLHSTPAPLLFQHARRDFSHGCIRVEDPVALGAWVLGWPAERVNAAMDGTPNRRVNLDAPIQVLIYYSTVAVVFDESAVHFAGDLYGQDAALDKALQ